MSLTLFLSLCLLAFSAVAVRLHGRDLNAQLSSSYDYVVCGCGVSGLVVANRLSEDPGVSVLCIEAGNADNYEEFIQVPQFVGSGILSQYDWRFATLPQIYLDGAQRLYPQGKGLGGGSLINAMCWNRGGADDYNAWEALGNPGWNWDSLLPYFIKSENYTPVFSEQIAQDLSINFNPAVHGSDGYVHVSYPKYFYSQSRNLFSGMEQLGVPIVFDPNDGTNAGASFIPTALDPDNQTRSDARRTYFDPFINRPNFHVVTGQQCTRAIFEGVVGNTAGSVPMTGGNPDGEGPGDTVAPSIGLFIGNSSAPPPTEGAANAGSRFMPRQAASGYRATGVEFAADAASPRQTVLASREVIFAAGALHSAQLLQLSGVGPPDLLARNNIPVAVSLPGVGNNLQDHYLVGTFYPYNNVTDSPAELSTNETYNAEARAQYYANKTGPWTAGSPNGVAFPSLPDTSNVTFDLLNSASIQPPEEYLVDGLDPSLVAGYAAQKSVLVELLNQRNIGAWEIINNNIGSLTVAVMHPFSRGTCSINSPNPFDPPVIDPRYGSNPTDLQILVEALLFNRRILATPPMVELQPAQFVPPVDADMDAIMQVIKNGIRTEFHPSGTCAMLPRELGGVVDPNLRVYGTQNLRVVDAGIMPLIPAAHLQAPVYAVAERAADIIKADNIGTAASPSASAYSSVSIPVSVSSSVGDSLIPSSETTSSNPVASSEPAAASTTTSTSAELVLSIPPVESASTSASQGSSSSTAAPSLPAPSTPVVTASSALEASSSTIGTEPPVSASSVPAGTPLAQVPSVSPAIASMISALVSPLPAEFTDGTTTVLASAIAGGLSSAMMGIMSDISPPQASATTPFTMGSEASATASAVVSSVMTAVEGIVSLLVPTLPETMSAPNSGPVPSPTIVPTVSSATPVTPAPSPTPTQRSTEQVRILRAAIQQFISYLRGLLGLDRAKT